MESIKTRGILEPILVTPSDGNYKLLCGERRLLAALTLGLESVPARIMTVTGKDEVLAHQLTENLQREDLNPMDQAKGIFSFIQAKHPDRNYDVDGVMSALVWYDRKQDDLPQDVVDTLSTTAVISGKSTRTLSRTLSLLKLPDPIQAALSDESLPVSQGYLFAANLDCPDVAKIFEQITKKPVTNAALENLLTEWKKPKPESGDGKAVALVKKASSLKSWRTGIEESKTTFKAEDLKKFLDELQALVSVVQEKMKGQQQ
jgi:ParB family transcriptional regulator, chromosome partitioning protein